MAAKAPRLPFEDGFLILAMREAMHQPHPSPTRYKIEEDPRALIDLHECLNKKSQPKAHVEKPAYLRDGAVEVDLSVEQRIIHEFIARCKIDELPELIEALGKGKSVAHLHFSMDEIQCIQSSFARVKAAAIASNILRKDLSPKFPKLDENAAFLNTFFTKLTSHEQLDDEDEFVSADEEPAQEKQDDTEGIAKAMSALEINPRSPSQALEESLRHTFHTDGEFAAFLCRSLLPRDILEFELDTLSQTFKIVFQSKHQKLMQTVHKDGIVSLEHCSLLAEKVIQGRMDPSSQTVHFHENHLSMEKNTFFMTLSGAMTSISLDANKQEIFMGTNPRLLPRIGPYTKDQFYKTFDGFSWG